MAQLIALVLAIVLVRGSMVAMGGFMVNAAMGDVANELAILDDGASLEMSVGVPPPVDGDALSNAPPGRREGPVHEDHDRAGQLVIRDGQRVVLIDDSDPENEIWIPLDDKPPLPWYARSGLVPLAAAIVGGAGLYLLMWGCGTLLGRLVVRESETS